MKQIPGYPDYFATTDGRIFSINKKSNKGNTSVPRELRSWKNRGKHLAIAIIKEGKSRRAYVHDLILETFIGPRSYGQMCRHLDGNGLNNNLSNLKWGTMKENQLDRIFHGTDNRGEKHGMSKLSVDDVLEIKRIAVQRNKGIRKLDKGGSYKEIAQIFNVAASTVGHIVRGSTWGWLNAVS